MLRAEISQDKRSHISYFVFYLPVFLHSACSPADKKWDTLCIFYLTIIVLSEIVALAALWVLHHIVIEPADSAWCCQSFKVIAVMQRCFFETFAQDCKHWSRSQAEQKLIVTNLLCYANKSSNPQHSR